MGGNSGLGISIPEVIFLHIISWRRYTMRKFSVGIFDVGLDNTIMTVSVLAMAVIFVFTLRRIFNWIG